jgi:hypothetical protein
VPFSVYSLAAATVAQTAESTRASFRGN